MLDFIKCCLTKFFCLLFFCAFALRCFLPKIKRRETGSRLALYLAQFANFVNNYLQKSKMDQSKPAAGEGDAIAFAVLNERSVSEYDLRIAFVFEGDLGFL